MKHILLALIAILFNSTAYAGTKLSLESGNMDFAKSKSNASFVLDMRGAMLDKEKNYAENCETLSGNIEMGTASFLGSFNGKSRNLQLNTDGTYYDYKVIFTITNIINKPGDDGRPFYNVVGTIKVIDNATDAEKAVIKVKVDGMGDFVEQDRFTKVMIKAGLAFAKFVSK